MFSSAHQPALLILITKPPPQGHIRSRAGLAGGQAVRRLGGDSPRLHGGEDWEPGHGVGESRGAQGGGPGGGQGQPLPQPVGDQAGGVGQEPVGAGTHPLRLHRVHLHTLSLKMIMRFLKCVRYLW